MTPTFPADLPDRQRRSHIAARKFVQEHQRQEDRRKARRACDDWRKL
jgi:hypothetical protein